MIFRNFNKILFFLLAAASLSGCVREIEGGEVPEPANGNDTRFTVNVPGMLLPSTRSIAGDQGESVVRTIDIFVFDGTNELISYTVGMDIAPVVDNPGYLNLYSFTADLDINLASGQTIVFIANAREQVANILNQNPQSKDEIFKQLIYSSGYAGNSNTNKWNATDSSDFTPIPMYGELRTGSQLSDPIELTRMLARIDLELSAEAYSVFSPQVVYVANYNMAGYIAPSMSSSNEPIPPGAFVQTTAIDKAIDYPWIGSQELSGEIYLYEANANPDYPMEENGDHAKAICLIVKGKYMDAEYYYRIDFTEEEDGTPSEKRKYLPVLRNHHYTFEITAVNGPGYPATPAGFMNALKSLGVMNNLKTKVHVVDQSAVKDIVYNGQHYIGLGESATLGSETGYTLSVPCITNYAYGWGIEKIEYETGIGWLKAVKSGDNIDLTTNGYNLAAVDRVAYVHVRAGRLTHKLKVTQVEHLLYVGRFAGELVENDGVWQFERELWIQAADAPVSPPIPWSTENIVTDVKDFINGRSNTYSLYNRGSSKYPVASFCVNKNSGAVSTSSDLVWYLPARDQLIAVWISRSSYPPDKSKALPYHLWSSTERDGTTVQITYFSYGDTTYQADKSNATGAVMIRCVREYPIRL